MTITDTRTDPATATSGSAYPPTIADLMPRARELAESEGGLPSRNQVMSTLRVGAPKARKILAGLAGEGYEPATGPKPDPNPDPDAPDPVAADGARVETGRAGDVPKTTEPGPTTETDPDSPGPVRPDPVTETVEAPQDTAVADPGPAVETKPVKPSRPIAVWPVLLLLLPATVAIWSGWVGLGELAGFGPINPLPGIWDSLEINTAITLPIGMETYSAYALYVWLSGRATAKAVKFARASALLALGIGSAGQVAYHLIAAPDAGAGPVITAVVACIPVAVLGLGAALAHLVKNHDTDH